jgi:hypothetical protein
MRADSHRSVPFFVKEEEGTDLVHGLAYPFILDFVKSLTRTPWQTILHPAEMKGCLLTPLFSRQLAR